MTAPRDPEERGNDEHDLDRQGEGEDRGRPDLPADMEENRNLSGSSSWETLEEEAGNREVRREED